MTSDPLPNRGAIPMPTQEPLAKKRTYIPLSNSIRAVYKISYPHQKDIGTRTRWLER